MRDELTIPLAVTIKEGTRLMGISRTRTYELIKGRQLEAVKAGRRTLLIMESVRSYLASLPRA